MHTSYAMNYVYFYAIPLALFLRYRVNKRIERHTDWGDWLQFRRFCL